MNVSEQVVSDIVRKVLERLGRGPTAAGAASRATVGSGIFPDLNSAVDAARVAHETLAGEMLELRDKIIRAMRRCIVDNAEALSRDAVAETGLGRAEDKIAKNVLAAESTPGLEILQPIAFSGDDGLTLIERAPWGVIGSITPCTNPTETIINNAIGMVAAGNAVVFNAHPLAKGVSSRAIQLLNKSVTDAGGPPNLLSGVAEPTIETAQAMMSHPGIALLVVTGGPAVVKAAMASGKKVIAAGPGNPPALVDETAVIRKAARDIVSGASLDNNIVCIDEKVCLAVKSIADELKEEMKKSGAIELNASQADRLTDKVLAEKGSRTVHGAPAREFVGRDARVLLDAIGIKRSEDIRLIIAEVDLDHPLVWTEQLMPFLPVVRVKDVEEGIFLAKEVEQGCRHTATMHSRNIEMLSRMARTINTSLFVKNGPAYAGLGKGGVGYTSFTIAGPTGEGMTTARNFTRERRCTLVDYFRIV